MSVADASPIKLVVRHEMLAANDPRLAVWVRSCRGLVGLERWIECWYQVEIVGGVDEALRGGSIQLEVVSGSDRDPVWTRGVRWNPGSARSGLTTAGPTGPFPVQEGSALTFRVLSDQKVLVEWTLGACGTGTAASP